jgi:hypothetical protein
MQKSDESNLIRATKANDIPLIKTYLNEVGITDRFGNSALDYASSKEAQDILMRFEYNILAQKTNKESSSTESSNPATTEDFAAVPPPS